MGDAAVEGVADGKVEGGDATDAIAIIVLVHRVGEGGGVAKAAAYTETSVDCEVKGWL